MFVKSILNFEKASKEAELIVSDGKYNILCNAWEFDDNNPNFYLSGFFVKNIMRAYKNEYIVEKLNDSFFSYKLQGKLVDKKNKIVEIGKLTLEIDGYIPNDILVNEFIEFTVLRIDFTN